MVAIPRFTSQQRQFLLKEVERLKSEKREIVRDARHDDPLLDRNEAILAAQKEFLTRNPKTAEHARKRYLAKGDASYSAWDGEIRLTIYSPAYEQFMAKKRKEFERREQQQRKKYDALIALIDTTADEVKRSVMFDSPEAATRVLAKLASITPALP